MRTIKKYLLGAAVLVLSTGVSSAVFAQDKNVDKVIAVIGDDVILKSDVEAQVIQYMQQGMTIDDKSRCVVFKDILVQKLILDQAKLDSVSVGEAQIAQELERRLRYFISQFGSEQKLEEFYQKSILEIKAEFHDLVEDQLKVQQMQQKLTGDVKITPGEVRTYFNSIPKDSLPFINSEVEVGQIVVKPPVSKEEDERTREKLNGFRERVLNGENFGTLCFLYSEDPGSAKKNGELGFMPRNAFVPEFAAVGFKLKKGELSELVKTEYGYHIIQMVERRGEEANLRHMLIKPKVSPYDLQNAKLELDTIAGLLGDSLTFEAAASKYSQDDQSKNNGGVMVNPQTGSTRFEMNQLSQVDGSLFYVLDKLEVGKRSDPILMQNPDGSKAYRIVKLLKRTEPHQANLVDDYQRLQEGALQEKQAKAMMDWFAKKVDKTYIRIGEDYKPCGTLDEWGIQ